MRYDEIKVGMKVIPDITSEFFKNWRYQYTDSHGNIMTGTIVDNPYISGAHGETYWVYVDWSDGKQYCYPTSLLLSCEMLDKEQERSDKMYELPYLPGQRVCLNPEMDKYQDVVNSIKCDTGYVVKLDMALNELKYWSTFKNKQNQVVQVQLDNGSIYNLILRNLLLIDAPPRTAHCYTLSTGYNYLYVEGNVNEQSIIERMDNEVINKGRQVMYYEKYDNEWRAKVTQDILNYSSNQSSVTDTKPAFKKITSSVITDKMIKQIVADEREDEYF